MTCPHCSNENVVFCTGSVRGAHFTAKVYVREIICAYSADKCVTIITRERGEFTAAEHFFLQDIERLGHFLRLSRAAIVDPRAVLAIEGTSAVLAGTAYRPHISRRCLPTVRREFQRAA